MPFYILFEKEGQSNECFRIKTANPKLIKGYIEDHPETEDWLLLKGVPIQVDIDRETKIKTVAFDES